MLVCSILCTVILIVRITREHVHMDTAHEHFQMNANVDAFVASMTEITNKETAEDTICAAKSAQ